MKTTIYVPNNSDTQNAIKETCSQIIDLITKKYGILPADLNSRKKKECIHVRNICIFLCRQLTVCSIQDLVEIFDLTTITIIKTIDKMLVAKEKNPELKKELELLKKELT